MSEWWRSFLELFRGKPSGPSIGGLPEHWPTQEDVEFSRKAGFGYGTGIEGLLESGRHIPGDVHGAPTLEALMDSVDKNARGKMRQSPDVADLYMTNALASGRSGIASLGFDPRRTAVDRLPGRSNYGGLYRDSTDTLWSRAESPTSLTHESIHRGFKRMKDAGNQDAKYLDYMENEGSVRRIMQQRMGDPERPPDGLVLPDYEAMQIMYDPVRSPSAAMRQRNLDRMERAAAEMIAKRRDRGPR